MSNKWKREIDPHYAMLIAAIKRRAEEEGGENKIVDCLILKGASNVAWMLVRYENADLPLFLFYGQTTMHPILRRDQQVEKTGAGIDISFVPWEQQLLDPMVYLAKRETLESAYCSCGHFYERVITGLGNSRVCPSCGNTDTDPEMWPILTD